MQRRLFIATPLVAAVGCSTQKPVASQPKPWPVRALTALSDREAQQLPEMPAKPRLLDFLKLRATVGQHLVRAAKWAIAQGHSDAVIAACMLHDLGESLVRADHGYWSEQMIRPYVSEEVAWAVRQHQILRFYADPAAGYKGAPKVYDQLFGEHHKPDAYIDAAYQDARKHEWYMTARLVTVADQDTPSQKQLYSGEEQFPYVDPAELTDVIGRVFKEPADGLGYDGTPVAHMWRTLIHPTRVL
jgi:hypothetical protein